MSTMSPEKKRPSKKDADGEMGDGDEKRGRGFARRKVCRFCADKNAKVDYKDQ